MADAIISVVTGRIAALNEIYRVRGVKKELESLSNEVTTIRCVLDDAERRGYTERSVKVWLKKLEYMSYEVAELLDEWEFALLKLDVEQSDAAVAPKLHKVCSFLPIPIPIPIPLSPCLCFKKVSVHRDIGHKIKQVKALLDPIMEERCRFNFVRSDPPTYPFGRPEKVPTAFVELEEPIYGRSDDMGFLLSKIMAEGTSEEEPGVRVISIVGPAGIGKTVLARRVYDYPTVKSSYQLRMWTHVGDPFDLAGIANMILESIGESSPDTYRLDLLLGRLQDSISGKKLLLVLDDVSTGNKYQWDALQICLRRGAAGSTILVTTRNQSVAEMMGTMEHDMLHLGLLSVQECWFILRRIAFFGRSNDERENFRGTGMKIANQCTRLPLAVKTLGILLRFKTTIEEWEAVLESQIRQLEEAKVGIFPYLSLSYDELSPILKNCFSYFAIFPKGHVIHVEGLIRMWMALDYLGSNDGVDDLELRWRVWFDELAISFLFQDLKRDQPDGHVVTCKMSNKFLDFAHSLREKKIRGRMEAGVKETTCQTCCPSLVSRVKAFRSLFCYKRSPLYLCDCTKCLSKLSQIQSENSPPNLCDCLKCLRVLSLNQCGLRSIPKGMEKLIHLRYLDLSRNGRLSQEDFKIICKLYTLRTLLLCECAPTEIPSEIGNLIKLRHLDLSFNYALKELPKSICNLQELRSLNVDHHVYLPGLPKGIHQLVNGKFKGELSALKGANQLRGSLELEIRRIKGKNDVDEARKAELNKKEHLQKLIIRFEIVEDVGFDDQLWTDVIEALEPNPNLVHLGIYFYGGSKLPDWITSSLVNLRQMELHDFNHLTFFPPFGKLPRLEELTMYALRGLHAIGREFLGIDRTALDRMDNGSSSSAPPPSSTVFPKLKKLTFAKCNSWTLWEDITAKEELYASVMPRLEELGIICCQGLKGLPHRLLRKAKLLKKLDIRGSQKLRNLYIEEGSSWEHIPHIRLSEKWDIRDSQKQRSSSWKYIAHIPNVVSEW